MAFTHILFLLASVAVAGPLLAHLLNRSKFRRVPFTMLQFLQVSQKQTQSKRRLRDFLILLLRCAIIVLIATLFAGPVIYQQISKGMSKDIHFLVLDDSLSMSCKAGMGTCFDEMIDETKDYLNTNKGPTSVFHLYSMTQGSLGKDLTAEAALLSMEGMDIGHGRTDLTGLWADLKNIQHSKGRSDTVNVHVVSDFTDDIIKTFRNQSSSIDLDEFSYDIIGENLKPNNLAVTHANVINVDDGRITLSATVVNYGNEKTKRLIRAGMDSTYSNEVLVNPAPGIQENVVLTMDASELLSRKSFLPIEIKLSPDDDLTADDVYPIAVSMQSASKKRVLLLGYDSQELFLMRTALKTLEQSAGSCIESIDTVAYSQLQPDRLFSYDVVIASTVARSFEAHTGKIQQHIESGGRWIFFADDRVHEKTAKALYNHHVLPALPQQKRTAIEGLGKLEMNTVPADSAEGRMLSILAQYRLETIPLWNYYQCVPHTEATCLWPIDSAASLVYQKPVKSGCCTFVNTSIDDSSSAITKNPAVLPLVKHLLGQQEQVSEFHYACDEMIRVPMDKRIPQQEVDYLDGRGDKQTTQATGGVLQIAAPHRPGWIRTLTEPVYYAGVHPAKGETDLRRSFPGQIEKITAGLFVTEPDEKISQAAHGFSKQARALDKILVWLIILLISIDCFIANRMQRS